MNDYLTTLITLIIGLAIADLALSAHRLAKARRRVRWHWMSPLVAIILLLQLLGFWWIWFGAYSGLPSISIARFLPDLIILLLLFLVTAAALPDEVDRDGVDLKAYYFENASYLWTLFAIYCAIPSPTIDASLFNSSLTPIKVFLYEIPNIALVATGIVLAWSKRPAVHAVLLILLFAWTLFFQLQVTMVKDQRTISASSPTVSRTT